MGHDYSKFRKKFGTDAVSYKWKLSVYFKFIFDKGARGQYNGLVDYITASETKSDHKIELHVLITHVSIPIWLLKCIGDSIFPGGDQISLIDLRDFVAGANSKLFVPNSTGCRRV